MTNDLCTPWTLTFDRDGTEDFGIILDAEGSEIVASHLPERQEGYGNCFWLPERENDRIPLAVRQMRLMAAAPKLLAACEIALATFEEAIETEDPQGPTQMEWEAEPMATLRAAIAEAENGPAKV